MRKMLILAFAISVMACACGGSSKAGSSPSTAPTTTASSAPTTSVKPCGPSENGCSSARVIAAVEQLYVKAGASPAEAECLAPITGEGKSEVNQAFDVPKPGETGAAIKCVGSEARLRTIATALGAYFAKHPFG